MFSDSVTGGSCLVAYLAATALIFIIIFSFLFVKQQPPSSPHGSMGWPLFGETLGFLRPHKSNSIGTFLEHHCSRYGKIFKSHLFGSPTIVSCDLEFNNFILQNEERLFRSSYPKPVRDILGKLSLMLVSGELHKKLRSITISLINASKSRPEFLHCTEKLSISVLNSWKEQQEVPFMKEAKKFTFYLMLKNLLDIEPGDPLASEILEDFLTFMKGFVSLPLYVPGTAYTKAMKARSRISSTLKHIIQEREKCYEENAKGSYIDEILLKGHLNDEEKVSIMLDILLAGYETTSGLLALVLYFLAKQPDALERLKQEHQDLRRRKKHGELLTWEDYKQMCFTSHVINEAMRCGNLVKFLHRKALKDIKFKEYIIPAGWQVLPVLCAPHLDPSLHQHPSEFNPWRWTDQATSRKVNPFGGGLRLCPGVELAKVETAFFLHHLVLNYRWRTKEDDCPMSYPYMEFSRGLLLEIEKIEGQIM